MGIFMGHHIGNPTYSSEGVNEEIKPTKLLDFDPPYPGTEHVRNWCDCIRNGGQPNANMDFGYMQGIAVLLGDAAYSLGRKVVFERVFYDAAVVQYLVGTAQPVGFG